MLKKILKLQIQTVITMNFKNKRVWITGASSGIGENLAYAFASQGAHLILSARNESELERVKNNCHDAASVFIYPIDLENLAGIQNTAKRVLERYGKIDILINNAGISQRSLAKETSLEVDQKIMNINFFGTIALTKAVLPSMITHQLGHIVVITSAVGIIGSPLRSTYAASKHALHGFFDSLRAEIYKDNIQVTIVCPGFVRTNVSVNALTGSGEKQNVMDEATNNGMSPGRLSRKIMRAIQKGKEEVYYGGREVLAIYVKRYFPSIFSRIIRKAKVT